MTSAEDHVVAEHGVGLFSGLIAHPDQVAGTRLSRVVGGSGDGALLLTIWTPAGTEVDLQVDRGLDILSVRHRGRRFGWAGPTGLAARSQFEPGGFGWQRTFYGGLLTTCGLEHVGDPLRGVADDQLPPSPRSVDYGEHGRIAHAAADIVERTISERDNVIRVRGVIRQGAIYGERFELDRTIEVKLDRAEITVTDVVRNIGSLPARHAILYHLNFGYPIAHSGTTVSSGVHTYTIPPLTPDAEEVVQRWRGGDGDERRTEVASAGGDAMIRCTQSASLRHLFMWNVPRSRTNVVGIAPSSTPLEGEEDRMPPGGTMRYWIRVEVEETS